MLSYFIVAIVPFSAAIQLCKGRPFKTRWLIDSYYGFLLVFRSNYRPRMHRLATVHARDNQPTTNDARHSLSQ